MCIVSSPAAASRRTAQAGSHGRANFFLAVKPLARLFRRLFLERLQAAFDAGELGFFGDLAALADPRRFAAHLARLRRVDWVVYAKKPFGGPAQVLAYLGRYTHRVAIANSRLVACDQHHVAFTWKDYRRNGAAMTMRLTPDEFIRRFLLHTLPDGFHRIRHFGFLANGHRAAKLALARALPTRETEPDDTAASAAARERPPSDPRPRCCDLPGMRRVMRLIADVPRSGEWPRSKTSAVLVRYFMSAADDDPAHNHGSRPIPSCQQSEAIETT